MIEELAAREYAHLLACGDVAALYAEGIAGNILDTDAVPASAALTVYDYARKLSTGEGIHENRYLFVAGAVGDICYLFQLVLAPPSQFFRP